MQLPISALTIVGPFTTPNTPSVTISSYNQYTILCPYKTRQSAKQIIKAENDGDEMRQGGAGTWYGRLHSTYITNFGDHILVIVIDTT